MTAEHAPPRSPAELEGFQPGDYFVCGQVMSADPTQAVAVLEHRERGLFQFSIEIHGLVIVRADAIVTEDEITWKPN